MSTDCIQIMRKLLLAASLTLLAVSPSLYAQNTQGNIAHYKVSESSDKLTMTAGTSLVLTMEHDVPFVVVGNQEIIKANPISPNQIMVTAIKPGITALSVNDPKNNSHTIEVNVIGDVRQLQATLEHLFPDSEIHARALPTGVVLTGHVGRADTMPQIVEVSQAYFPTVTNLLSVGGSQKVMLKVKVVEVSRTKLRSLGIDWSVLTSDFNLISGASGLINAAGTGGGGDFLASVTSGSTNFNLLIDALEQHNLAKILAEPTLTAMSGRPAAFLSGGEVPIRVNSGLAGQTVEYQAFGTKLDFVPIVLGGGRIRLEVRPEVRELAGDLSDPGTGSPGFRTRRVDTGVEMQVGQTLALAGLIQNRVDSTERGFPVLKDMPWIGAAFRKVTETYNEVELVVLITPYFVNEVDGSILPVGPGRSTVSPNQSEFYINGYREVPSCNNPYELGPISGGGSYQGGTIPSAPEMQSLPNVSGDRGISQPINTLEETSTSSVQPQSFSQPLSGFGQPRTFASNKEQTSPQKPSQSFNPTRTEKVEPSTVERNLDSSSRRREEVESSTRYFPRPSLFGIEK